MCCGGFPYPRSSREFAADTLAAGADLGLVIIDTSVSIASPVCARGSSFTSATTLGLPPGLPLWPFLKGFPMHRAGRQRGDQRGGPCDRRAGANKSRAARPRSSWSRCDGAAASGEIAVIAALGIKTLGVGSDPTGLLRLATITPAPNFDAPRWPRMGPITTHYWLISAIHSKRSQKQPRISAKNHLSIAPSGEV